LNDSYEFTGFRKASIKIMKECRNVLKEGIDVDFKEIK
jgi:hypothetical protein